MYPQFYNWLWTCCIWLLSNYANILENLKGTFWRYSWGCQARKAAQADLELIKTTKAQTISTVPTQGQSSTSSPFADFSPTTSKCPHPGVSPTSILVCQEWEQGQVFVLHKGQCLLCRIQCKYHLKHSSFTPDHKLMSNTLLVYLVWLILR